MDYREPIFEHLFESNSPASKSHSAVSHHSPMTRCAQAERIKANQTSVVLRESGIVCIYTAIFSSMFLLEYLTFLFCILNAWA